MTASARWYTMTEGERYAERERVIREVNALGLWASWKRPDVAVQCYESVKRMRAANDRLAVIMAKREAADLANRVVCDYCADPVRRDRNGWWCGPDGTSDCPAERIIGHSVGGKTF